MLKKMFLKNIVLRLSRKFLLTEGNLKEKTERILVRRRSNCYTSEIFPEVK
jgi:hypothetical protein